MLANEKWNRPTPRLAIGYTEAGVSGPCQLFCNGRPVLTGSHRQAIERMTALGLDLGGTYSVLLPKWKNPLKSADRNSMKLG